MKKGICLILICIILTTSTLIGCGHKKAPSVPEENSTEKVLNTEKEEPPIVSESDNIPEGTSSEIQTEELVIETMEDESAKEVILLLSILSVEEGGTYKACNIMQEEFTLSVSENLPAGEQAFLSPGAVVSVTAIEAAEEESKNTPILIVSSVTSPSETTETEELRKAAFKIIHGFSVDESISGIKFAKQAVNVRSGPSTDYEKIDSLTFAQEVSVTGVADTGWYRINLNGQDGYVSNKYLIDEKPKIQVAAIDPGAGSTPSQEENTLPDNNPAQSENTSNDFFAVYSEAEMNAALEKGDLVTYFQMLNANSSSTMAGGSEGTSSTTENADSSPVTQEKITALSADFINHLNSKREEAGLSTLAWSDSMGSTALERAEEVVNDFSHNGVRNCTAENIGMFTTNSVSTWYDEFYNSSTHKLNMMDSTYKTAAAAVCQSGNSYYVVVLFGF